jgi:hypothetical protein
MASITVKKLDGTTDIVYAAATASAGDRSPAVWRPTTNYATLSHRPKFSLVIRDNQKSNGRIFQFNYNMPVLEDVNGVTVVTANIPIAMSGTLPTNVPIEHSSEAFAQCVNLLDSALIADAIEEAYAPT